MSKHHVRTELLGPAHVSMEAQLTTAAAASEQERTLDFGALMKWALLYPKSQILSRGRGRPWTICNTNGTVCQQEAWLVRRPAPRISPAACAVSQAAVGSWQQYAPAWVRLLL